MSFRSWFCKHEHIVIAETYAPPNDLNLRCFGCTAEEGRVVQDQNERAAAGVTSVLIRCSKCGDVQKHELLGKSKGSA